MRGADKADHVQSASLPLCPTVRVKAKIMATPTIIHGLVFGAGAAIGAVGAGIWSKKQQVQPVPAPMPSPSTPPVVSGTPKPAMSAYGMASHEAMRFGNPGERRRGAEHVALQGTDYFLFRTNHRRAEPTSVCGWVRSKAKAPYLGTFLFLQKQSR